ncbi:MAG: hypothetical protein WB974_06630, partial [Acidobacteriaceae bacterium]
FDLIEDYHAGRMADDERRRTEAAFSPERLGQRPSLERAINEPRLPAGLKTGRRTARPWLRWAIAAAALAICVAGGRFIASRLHTQSGLSRMARKATPGGNTGQPSTSGGAEGDTTAVLVLAADVARGPGGPALDLLPATRAILVQWVVPSPTQAQSFLLSISKSGRILSTTQQDGRLKEIDGREVASFRLAPSTFAGVPAESQVLMLIRSADAPQSSEAEFTVSVSRR